MFTHQCIKPGCENSYEDEEIDAYYCPSCNSARKQLAKELDKKFNTKGQQPNDMFAGSEEVKMGNGRIVNFFQA